MKGKYVPINYTPSGVLKKYKPLRKVRVPLQFSLVYFPFYLVEIVGGMTIGIIRNREVKEIRAINGLSGTVNTVMSHPPLSDETEQCVEVQPIIFKLKSSIDVCKRLASENVKKMYDKKYGGPLRPKLTLTLEVGNHYLAYKPYWVITDGENLRFDTLMIVDAVTGLAGIPESNMIKQEFLLLSNKD